jgi:hypothetical protein
MPVSSALGIVDQEMQVERLTFRVSYLLHSSQARRMDFAVGAAPEFLGCIMIVPHRGPQNSESHKMMECLIFDHTQHGTVPSGMFAAQLGVRSLAFCAYLTLTPTCRLENHAKISTIGNRDKNYSPML